MKRHFIFKDGTSQKFWNIEVNGKGFTVTYGKLGTTGQTSTKEFDDEAKCQKEADKLIAEKTKKGYTEVNEETVLNEKNEAKKYGLSYEDYEEKDRDNEWLIEKILNDKRLPELKFITIGNWAESYESDPQAIIDMFVEHKDKFKQVESLFFGDIESEECEVSWIQQGNFSKIYDALPNLKSLTIKGSTGLELGDINHPKLEKLEIICGGLSVVDIKCVLRSKLPKLETLILYLGVEDYGWDGAIGDLEPLASKKLFPNLKYLGLVNSEIQNEIVGMILESDILPQLETLDLSYGCLTDKGGQMLLDNADKLSHLKKMVIDFHYLTDDMMKKLKKLPFEVHLADQQEEDEDYMSPMLTE